MNEISKIPHADHDSISYQIYVAMPVPMADVTVTAHLEFIENGLDETSDFESRVRGVLKDFIDTEWDLSAQERITTNRGKEKIRLKAVAKISVVESRFLDERKERISRDGIEVCYIQVDRSLSLDLINQVIKDLSFEAVEKVTADLEGFNRASARQWRICDIAFGVPRSESLPIRKDIVSSREEAAYLFGNFVEMAMVGLKRISLTAAVTLRSEIPHLK